MNGKSTENRQCLPFPGAPPRRPPFSHGGARTCVCVCVCVHILTYFIIEKKRETAQTAKHSLHQLRNCDHHFSLGSLPLPMLSPCLLAHLCLQKYRRMRQLLQEDPQCAEKIMFIPGPQVTALEQTGKYVHAAQAGMDISSS